MLRVTPTKARGILALEKLATPLGVMASELLEG
jgi:hypothetical protein